MDLYNNLSLHTCGKEKTCCHGLFCVEVIWNGFLLVPCRFCGGKDGDGHLFWECTFPPILHVRELPEFVTLMAQDRRRWPDVFFGMAGCLVLVLLGRGILGRHILVILRLGRWNNAWVLILRMTLLFGPLLIFGMLIQGIDDRPSVWTDGSREDYPVGGFEVAGAEVYLPAPEEVVRGASWRTTEDDSDARLERCRDFMSVLGPLLTVQRVEFWGAIVALQAFLALSSWYW